MAPLHEGLDAGLLPLEAPLDIAVVEISHPPRDPETQCLLDRVVAEGDPLHEALHGDDGANLRHCSPPIISRN